LFMPSSAPTPRAAPEGGGGGGGGGGLETAFNDVRRGVVAGAREVFQRESRAQLFLRALVAAWMIIVVAILFKLASTQDGVPREARECVPGDVFAAAPGSQAAALATAYAPPPHAAPWRGSAGCFGAAASAA